MRTKTIVLFLGLILIACACTTAGSLIGSGDIVEESRDVPAFDTIDVCCGMELELSQGEEVSLRVKADDNLLDEIVARSAGDKLTIEYRSKTFSTHRPSTPIKIYATTPVIHGIEVSGGGRFEAEQINTEDLSIRLSGGSEGVLNSTVTTGLRVDLSGGGRFESDNLETSNANFDLSGGSDAEIEAMIGSNVDISVSGGGDVHGLLIKADNLSLDLSGGSETMLGQFTGGALDVQISGGGNAEIAGDSDSLVIDLSGGSSFDGPDLKSGRVEVNGSGNATVWATETLVVDLSGGGIVEYFGDPQITSQLSGGSKVRALGGR